MNAWVYILQLGHMWLFIYACVGVCTHCAYMFPWICPYVCIGTSARMRPDVNIECLPHYSTFIIITITIILRQVSHWKQAHQFW